MWYLWSLETFVTSIYVGKVLSKLQLFHAEQMSLYNFIILRKKETPTEVYSCGICKTFKGSGGCLWKHVTYYYVIKNYIGYKLAIFNSHFYSVGFIVNQMMRYETQAWFGVTLRGTSRQQKPVLKQKKVLLMLYYTDKNWYHFIKEYL